MKNAPEPIRGRRSLTDHWRGRYKPKFFMFLETNSFSGVAQHLMFLHMVSCRQFV